MDNAIRAAIKARSEQDPDFWTFRSGTRRSSPTFFFQYPAMMVPQMQRELLRIVAAAQPNIMDVLDPFVGSGTVVGEAMLGGFNVLGQDINPLAILLSKVRVGPFLSTEHLREVTRQVTARAEQDQSPIVESPLPTLSKWFTPEAVADLSKLRRAIRSQPDLWTRRFCWVSLAETIRQCSKSRPSTFKLHIRTDDDVEGLARPLDTFSSVMLRNITTFDVFYQDLVGRGRLSKGRYQRFADAHLADSSVTVRIPDHPSFDGHFDLLITSPPYGDNLTTVTYGQYSYLPLWWIDQEDIADGLDLGDFLRTTQQIDRSGLGGKVSTQIAREERELLEVSPSLRDFLRLMPVDKPDRAARVVSFCRDLRRSLTPILTSLRPNAYMIWTVGNRRVGGHEVPTDEILKELLIECGSDVVCQLSRPIVGKRMAERNAIAPTMKTEQVMVLRKRQRQRV